MKLTAKLKLLPTADQHAMLLETLETANAACNEIGDMAWAKQVFRQFALHKMGYKIIRAQYSLSAQIAVRAIGKVAQAYKGDKKVKRVFDLRGAFPYDGRILSLKTSEQTVSIWTMTGRQRMSYACGERQSQLLDGERGETDLSYVDGVFYLMVTCEVETPELADVDDVLGVDLGIVNLAVDSDGETYSGQAVEKQRRKQGHRRRNLQRKGTRAAKRKLRKLSGKQQRYQRNTNHCISKKVVQKAQGSGRGIALEDLKGIRDRVTVRRKQRARHTNWAFYDLQAKISYKAQLVGVPVMLVDPRNTSRACAVCGYIDKRNRPNQSTFSCLSCGHSDLADHNAARNIRARAAINRPNGQGPSVQGSATELLQTTFSRSYKLPAFSR